MGGPPKPAPYVPPPPPAPPREPEGQKKISAASQRARRARQAAGGYQSTILTGGLGVLEAAPTRPSTLG